MVGRNADFVSAEFIAAESLADDEGVDEDAFGNAEVVVVVVVDFDKEMSPVEMQDDSGAAVDSAPQGPLIADDPDFPSPFASPSSSRFLFLLFLSAHFST